MEHLFVPLQIAKEIKEIGFNEPCLAYFGRYKLDEDSFIAAHAPTNLVEGWYSAPTWDQLIEWFLKEKQLLIEIYGADSEGYVYCIEARKFKNVRVYQDGNYINRHTALVVGFTKIIQIVKDGSISEK